MWMMSSALSRRTKWMSSSTTSTKWMPTSSLLWSLQIVKEASLFWIKSNFNNTILTTVDRKPAHTDIYLDWNSNHPRSAKRSVIQALTHRAKMVCSTAELLAKEMDYLHRVLCRNKYPDWFLKKPNTRPQVDQSTWMSSCLTTFSCPFGSYQNLETVCSSHSSRHIPEETR